jgi:hypothetical protein
MLAAVIALSAALALAQAPLRSYEIHIAERRVPAQQRVLHLHGYDIETRVAPGKPAVTAFAARLTGRFPVEIHGEHAKHQRRALLYVEIYPR